MATTLLEVENLTVRFPRLAAVQDLSFSVGVGETLAIVGESGSGKSITALALMRLVPPPGRITGGSIRFDGRELTALPDAAMRKVRGAEIAMIFQEPMTSLNPVLTIGRQIGETVRLHEGVSRRIARARAIELLDLVRIPEPHRRVDDYPHQLSGGMRQRVMIAMAVICRPKLLIADEPTTALDVTIQAQVLALLDNLRRELSMGLLLITHDLGIVGQWADRVVVMYASRKVEEGSPDAILDAPWHPYTQGLMAASPRHAGDLHYRRTPLVEIPGSITSAFGETGCPFVPRCALAEARCREVVPPPLSLGDHLVACVRHDPFKEAADVALAG
ncbi:MAG: ABC transporter ATP-binding protein [Bauldia sp.]|nr:ABC transporter ATP-binding protein [Bauldia sp.]